MLTKLAAAVLIAGTMLGAGSARADIFDDVEKWWEDDLGMKNADRCLRGSRRCDNDRLVDSFGPTVGRAYRFWKEHENRGFRAPRRRPAAPQRRFDRPATPRYERRPSIEFDRRSRRGFESEYRRPARRFVRPGHPPAGWNRYHR